MTLPTKSMAQVLGVTTQHLNRLVRDGVVAKLSHGVFDVADTVQRHTNHRLACAEERRAAPGANRLRDIRGEEIAQRMAIKDGELVDVEEALAYEAEKTALFIGTLDGLAVLLSRDPAERERIESVIHGERERLSARFGEMAAARIAGRR